MAISSTRFFGLSRTGFILQSGSTFAAWAWTTWARPDTVAAAIRPDTALVIAETPANPTLKLTDIVAVAELTRPKGIWLGVDNTFASGAAFEPDTDDGEGRDARLLNEKVHRDPRVDATLVAVSDGLLVARKR